MYLGAPGGDTGLYTSEKRPRAKVRTPG